MEFKKVRSGLFLSSSFPRDLNSFLSFLQVSVNGIIYGEGVTEAMIGAAKREGREVVDFDEQAVTLNQSLKVMIEVSCCQLPLPLPSLTPPGLTSISQRMKKGWKNRYLQETALTLVAPDLAAHLADRSSPHRSAIMDLFRALAICHGVIADKPNPEEKPFHVDYKAESPDGSSFPSSSLIFVL